MKTNSGYTTVKIIKKLIVPIAILGLATIAYSKIGAMNNVATAESGISKSGKYSPRDKSGDQNNPRNLFTQTAYSNQKVQTIFEAKVRKALAKGDKVIYQATPIFKGSDKMARGINLQAVSVNNNDLDFNVYIFNSQPGYVFDYSTGQSKYNGKTNGSLNGLRTRYKQGQSVMQSAGKTTNKGLNNAAWLSKKLASASSYFYRYIVKNQK